MSDNEGSEDCKPVDGDRMLEYLNTLPHELEDEIISGSELSRRRPDLSMEENLKYDGSPDSVLNRMGRLIVGVCTGKIKPMRHNARIPRIPQGVKNMFKNSGIMTIWTRFESMSIAI